jgi:hypothetical protein
VGPNLEAARRLAAQTNAQLETGDVAMFSFEPIAIPELRRRWLEHHKHLLRSSVHTIARYRTATDHLLNFLAQHPVRHTSLFTARDSESFARYLRSIEVAPNGHKNSAKRPLLDRGIKYVLECCRALFNYSAKRRHLSPYARNPFRSIELDRLPIENAKPIVLLTREQEIKFLTHSFSISCFVRYTADRDEVVRVARVAKRGTKYFGVFQNSQPHATECAGSLIPSLSSQH